jgi:hypothetical protein
MPAVITTQPQAQAVCPGATAVFSVIAQGDPAPSYQWRKGGTAIPGAVQSTLTITQAGPDDAGLYDVIVQNDCAVDTSLAVALTLKTITGITVQPRSRQACIGDSVRFTVGAVGTNLSYQWRKDTNPISGATRDTLLIARLGPELPHYGDIVVPTGLARVSDTAGGRYVATVVALYGAIQRGQRVLPAERFVPAGAGKAVPLSDGVRATMLGGASRQELKTPQMVVFLDKGSQDGVARGDLFEIRRQPERLPDGTVRIDEVMATLQVVHTREHSATARVLGVISPDIPPGSTARQVAKLP